MTFEWDEQCQDALKVSIHILQLRLSWPAQPKENPGATYVTILDHSFGTLLAEENAEEKKMSCITTLECLWGRKKDLPASRKYAWRSYLPAKNCVTTLAPSLVAAPQSESFKRILNWPTLNDQLAN